MEEVDGTNEVAVLNRLLVLEREKRIRAERLVEAERQLLLQLRMSATCPEVEEGGADRVLRGSSRSSSCGSIRIPRNFSQDFTSSVMNHLSGELKEVLGSGKPCSRASERARPLEVIHIYVVSRSASVYV